MSRPSNFPPPFSAADFVAEPTDPADERIEVGVLIVGAGPAGLACAIRLGQLLEEHPGVAERLGEVRSTSCASTSALGATRYWSTSSDSAT